MPTYADPFRLRVTKGLTAALEEISVAQGYSYDLVGKVFRGRAVFGDSDPLPMISILQSSRPLEGQWSSPENSGVVRGVLELIAQGFVALDPVNPLDAAFHLSADIGRRLALLQQEQQRTGLMFGMKAVYAMDVLDAIVRPPDEISATAYSWQPIRLHVAEDFAIPYDDA